MKSQIFILLFFTVLSYYVRGRIKSFHKTNLRNKKLKLSPLVFIENTFKASHTKLKKMKQPIFPSTSDTIITKNMYSKQCILNSDELHSIEYQLSGKEGLSPSPSINHSLWEMIIQKDYSMKNTKQALDLIHHLFFIHFARAIKCSLKLPRDFVLNQKCPEYEEIFGWFDTYDQTRVNCNINTICYDIGEFKYFGGIMLDYIKDMPYSSVKNIGTIYVEDALKMLTKKALKRNRIISNCQNSFSLKTGSDCIIEVNK